MTIYLKSITGDGSGIIDRQFWGKQCTDRKGVKVSTVGGCLELSTRIIRAPDGFTLLNWNPSDFILEKTLLDSAQAVLGDLFTLKGNEAAARKSADALDIFKRKLICDQEKVVIKAANWFGRSKSNQGEEKRNGKKHL